MASADPLSTDGARRPALVSLADGQWPLSLRVRTKYPVFAGRFFAARSRNVTVIRLHGSVELAPQTGLADCVLDITASGRTMAANDLVEIADAGASTARLIANQAARKTRNDAVGGLANGRRRCVMVALSRLDTDQFRELITDRQREGFTTPELDAGSLRRLSAIFHREITVQDAVREIIAEVRAGGDAALREWTFRIDAVDVEVAAAPPDELRAACEGLEQPVRKALTAAGGGGRARWTQSGDRGAYARASDVMTTVSRDGAAHRDTRKTRINVRVLIDGTGVAVITLPLPFSGT